MTWHGEINPGSPLLQREFTLGYHVGMHMVTSPIPYLWYNGLVCLTCDVRVVGSPQQYAQCDEISTGSSHRCRPSIRDHLHTVISSLVPLVIGISSLVRTSSAAPHHQLGLQAQCYNFTQGPRTYIQLNSAAYQPMIESLVGKWS